MKTILILLTTSVFSAGVVNASVNKKKKKETERYCAEMLDGKKVIIHKGKVLTEYVTLENGTLIEPNGIVTRVNSKRRTLKVGECMDETGLVHSSWDDTRNDK